MGLFDGFGVCLALGVLGERPVDAGDGSQPRRHRRPDRQPRRRGRRRPHPRTRRRLSPAHHRPPTPDDPSHLALPRRQAASTRYRSRSHMANTPEIGDIVRAAPTGAWWSSSERGSTTSADAPRNSPNNAARTSMNSACAGSGLVRESGSQSWPGGRLMTIGGMSTTTSITAVLRARAVGPAGCSCPPCCRRGPGPPRHHRPLDHRCGRAGRHHRMGAVVQERECAPAEVSALERLLVLVVFGGRGGRRFPRVCGSRLLPGSGISGRWKRGVRAGWCGAVRPGGEHGGAAGGRQGAGA